MLSHHDNDPAHIITSVKRWSLSRTFLLLCLNTPLLFSEFLVKLLFALFMGGLSFARRINGFDSSAAPSVLRHPYGDQVIFRARRPCSRTCRIESLSFLFNYAGAISHLSEGEARGSKLVPSRHITKRIPASLRAKATTATLCPRRSAMRLAHA